MHTCTCTCTHTYAHMHMHICTHAHMHTRTCTHAHAPPEPLGLQKLNLAACFVIYVIYIFVSLILLLNLLIALLGSTFAKTQDEARLQGRMAFARIVLRLELVAEICGIDTHAGEMDDAGGHVHSFRDVARDVNGELPPDHVDENVFGPAPEMVLRSADAHPGTLYPAPRTLYPAPEMVLRPADAHPGTLYPAPRTLYPAPEMVLRSADAHASVSSGHMHIYVHAHVPACLPACMHMPLHPEMLLPASMLRQRRSCFRRLALCMLR